MAVRTDASRLVRRRRLAGIYAIVNEGAPDPVELTREILAAGVRLIQYRAKGGIIAHNARAMRELTRQFGALFILNDHWRDVDTYGADGAHVGPDDARFGELAHIRSCLQGRLLGISCGTQGEARAAQTVGADYIGVGSVFATSSKADAGMPIGIPGLRRVAGAVNVPVAAIGGITLESIPQIRDAGVAMAAVISAIASAANPRLAAQALVRAWNGERT